MTAPPVPTPTVSPPVVGRTGPLPEAAVQLLIEQERERIARAVLGGTMRRLSQLGFDLAAISGQVGGPASGRLSRAVDDVDDILEELRAAVFELERRTP